MKKLLSVFLALSMLSATMVMPAANAEDETSTYKVVHNFNYDNATNVKYYAYADYGTPAFDTTDSFSGTQSIKLSTSSTNAGLGLVDFLSFNGNWGNIETTKGNTYVVSFKVKKIASDATLFNLRDRTNGNAWIYNQADKFSPNATGWRTVSHTFTVGDSYSSDGSTLTALPVFTYRSKDAGSTADVDVVRIDDFRLVQINDTSILNGTDPTAEIAGISENEILITFSQEMMESDVTNPKAYVINGTEAQSVTYDAATKTASVVPAESLTYGSDVAVTVSAADYIGRALYTETTQKYVVNPSMVSTTLPEDGAEENVGRNTYSVTYDRAIASATVTVNRTAVSTVNVNGNTVSFEQLFNAAGEKTVSVTAVDAYGGTVTVTRTFNISSDWVTFTDFENLYNQENFAAKANGFMNNLTIANVELTGTQTHSGSYSLHTKDVSTGNAALITRANYGWAYAKDGSSFAGLEVGKTYKYSHWVYADEAATAVTPNVLVRKAAANEYYWIISNSNFSTLPKQQWNYFEATFVAETTELPFFYDIPANLYIDDIRLDVIPTAEEVSTTLPADGTNAELGYNEYSMTFDKDIASAQVTYNGKTADAAVSATDAKTITFGLAAIQNGDVTISVTDTKGASSVVTKTITVPDTLVAYTGFDKGVQWMQDYLWNNVWNTPFVSEGYRSPGYAAKLVTTDPDGYSVGLCEWETSRVDYGPKTTATGTGTDMTRHIESGKWYKVSFYAKAAVAGEKPTLGVARRKTDGQGEGVDMFEMTDELTKYESTFKAISDKLPFFYREEMNYEIILDDVLIEQIESPYDYTYNLSAKSVTKGASVTATLSNEKLDEPMNGMAAIALYKDGVLKECHITNVTNLASGSTVTTTAVTLPDDIDDGEYTVKAFLWENTAMLPMRSAAVISEPLQQ